VNAHDLRREQRSVRRRILRTLTDRRLVQIAALGPGVDLEHRPHADRLVEPERVGHVGDVDVDSTPARPAACWSEKYWRSNAFATPRLVEQSGHVGKVLLARP
jgi:hypothetical protein